MPGRRVFLNDVGPGDVGGHQVRRELYALEHEPKGLGNRAHHQGLGRARQTGNEAMAAYEQRCENLVQDVFLSNDHLANLRQDTVPYGLEPLDALLQLCRFNAGLCNGRHWIIVLSVRPRALTAASVPDENLEPPQGPQARAHRLSPPDQRRNTRVPSCTASKPCPANSTPPPRNIPGSRPDNS